jgi:hypothetical protein
MTGRAVSLPVAASIGATFLGPSGVVVAAAVIYFILGTVTFSTRYFPGPTESVIASICLWIVTVAALLWFPNGDDRKHGGEPALP